MLHPNAVIPVRFNKRSVSEQIITNVLAFFMIYLIIFFVSTIAFTLIEPDLNSSMGAVATCLGNIGPGLGKFGPAENFSQVPAIGKWFLSFLMLLGRLELRITSYNVCYTKLLRFSGAPSWIIYPDVRR